MQIWNTIPKNCSKTITTRGPPWTADYTIANRRKKKDSFSSPKDKKTSLHPT